MKYPKEGRGVYHYHQYQEDLLHNIVKGAIILFLVLILINSIWVFWDFWTNFINNIIGVLLILIQYWCLKLIKNKKFHLAARIHLSSSITVNILIVLFIDQQLILICALGIALFLSLAMFLDKPKFSNYWLTLSVGSYWIGLIIRILNPIFPFDFTLSDVLAFFLFPTFLLIGLSYVGCYISGQFNSVLIKSETIQKTLLDSEANYRKAYEIADFYKDLIAHDISNILNNISSSSQLSTINLNKSENQNKTQEYLDIINDEVQRGANLISNVRKLSELEESKIPMKSIELLEFLKVSIDPLKKAFHSQNVDIQIEHSEEKIFIQANSLLNDICGNIIDNAVKYNENQLVKILIKITKEQIEGRNYAKMEFIDNGIGIMDTQKEFTFKKGYKEHKGGKGMGFGLSLVKKIVDSYNGQVWVENRVKGDYKKGSIFKILIPQVVNVIKN